MATEKRRKDPAFASENEFDDDFMSDLDSFDSELDGFSVDTEDYDSEKNREPAGKLSQVAAHLGVLGRAAGGGAALGIAERVKRDMPDLSRLVGDSVDLASEAVRLKNDVMDEIRPTINQTKILSRQLMRYVKDVVPQKPYEALMNALDTPEEQRDNAPSKEEARATQQEQVLSNIFKAQMQERMLDRKREVVDKLIDDKVKASRHHELSTLTLDIRNQAIFQTNFTRSVMTAYMRKNLELSYRRMYLAEDTLEALKITSQMLEKRLDAIRHNTGLPDSQKIHITELAKKNAKERIIGSLQDSLGNYAKGIFSRVREQWIDPAKEMLGTTNDALSMLVDQLQMGEEFGEKFDIKKTLLGTLGGWIGKGIGRFGGQKLLAKMDPETRAVLANYAKMGKPGLIMLAEALRRGEIEGHEDLGRFLDSILPETDIRGGGTFTNVTYQNPEAPGAITKKFTTTVEEIIPGYLRMQTALLQKLATGKGEEQVYDFKSGEFVTVSQMNNVMYEEMMGTREQRAALMQGTANAIRKTLTGIGTKKAIEFEKLAPEVTLLMQNLANAGRLWGKDGFFPIEDIELYSRDPDADTEWGNTAFLGIKPHLIQPIATFLLSILTHVERDGSRSDNFPVRSALSARISEIMINTGGRHKATVEKMLSLGYSDIMKKSGLLKSTYNGNYQMTDDAFYGAYRGFKDQDLEADQEYYKKTADDKGPKRLDSFGREVKDMTFLEEKIKNISENGLGIGDRLKQFGSTAEGYISSAAKAAGLEEEYGQFKEWLNESFEDICAWMKEKRQKFDKLVAKVKNTVAMKAYQFLMYTDMAGAKVFAETFFDVKKKELKPLKKAPNVKRFKLISAEFRVPPTPQLVNYLARYSTLHRFMKMIHNAAAHHPVAWVLDTMLPESLVTLAELSEEEIQDILDGPDPAKELEAKMKGEIAEAARKTREWKPKMVDGRMQYGDPSAVIPMSGPQAPILALPMGPSEEELRKEATSFKRQLTNAKNKGQMNKYEQIRERARLHGHDIGEDTTDKTFLPKPKKPRQKKQTTAEKELGVNPPEVNRKAEGGIIDWYGGDPVGTISQPHLLAGGGALAGEHGKEVIVPLNHNESSTEAYLQAKAYHEKDITPKPLDKSELRNKPELYAKGGTADWNGSRLKGAAKFLDNTVRRAGRGLAKMLRNTDLKVGDYQEKLDSLADTLESGAKNLKAEQRTKRARTTVLNAYKELQKLTDKSSSVQYAKALAKLIRAAATDDGMDEIPPADRRLIKRIRKCMDQKDFKLAGIKSISPDTSYVFKKAVQTYQELSTSVEGGVDRLSSFYEEQKKNVTKKFDTFMEEHGEQIESVKTKTKGILDKGKEKLGGIFGAIKDFGTQITTKFDSTLTVGKSTLAQIAAKQLETLQMMLLVMQSEKGVIGKLTKEQLEQLNAATMGAKLDLRTTGQRVRDAIFGFVKRNAWDRPWRLAGRTLRAGKNLAQGFLTNRQAGVYRAPRAGEIFGEEHLLISEDDFKKGVFFDPEQKERVKSVQDINRPVYDGKGNALITERDIEQGLVDKNQKKIRTLSGTLGRFARNRVGDVYSLGKKSLGYAKDFLLSSKTAQFVANTVTTPFRTVSALLRPWVDVYRKDKVDQGPIALARDFERGLLVYEDGKKPRDVYSIQRPVVWADNPQKFAITWQDIDEGLVDKYNKPLKGAGFKLGSLARGAVGLLGKGANLLFGGANAVLQFAGRVVTGTAKYLFKGKNPYIDVYVPNKDGTIPIGSPKLTGENIRLGKYVYSDGSRVKSAYGISGAVLEASTGKVLITEQEVSEGLYSIDGVKLTSFAGKSIAGKALSISLNLAKKGLTGLGRGIKAIGKGLAKGAKFLTKGVFDTTSDILGYMHGQMMDILDTVFQRDTVKKVDLEVIVGKRLDKIYDAIKLLLPKNVAGDTDNDGDREGSYQDQEQKRKERAAKQKEKQQALAESKKAGKGAGAAAGGGTKEEDDDSWSLTDIAAAKDLWDAAKKSKAGRAISRGLGKAGKFIGRALPGKMLKGASGLASTLGMAGVSQGLRTAAATVGRQGLMTAARAGVMAGGGALLSTAGTALAGVGSAVGGAAAGAGALLATNPVGWAILAGGALYGGYKLVSWAISDSDNEKDWKQARLEKYGFTNDEYFSTIEKLEERTAKILDGEDRELEDSEIRDFAKKFDLIDDGYLFGMFGGDEEQVQKEKVEYFTTWYAKRFRPVFEIYLGILHHFGRRRKGDDLEPDDIDKRHRATALKLFKQNADGVLSKDVHNKDLVPTEEGYEKYKKFKEQAEASKETKSTTGATPTPLKTPESAMKEELEKKQSSENKTKGADAFATAISTAKSGNEAINNILKSDEEKNKTPFQNPITDVFAFATPLTGSFKLLSWAFGDSKTTAAWKVIRYELYGIDPKEQKDEVEDLEEKVLKIFDGNAPEFTDSDLEDFAKDFGIIDGGYFFGTFGGDSADVVKEKLSYFTTWYAIRFRPIFETYIRLVRYYTKGRPGSKVDPDEIPEKKIQEALQTFKSEAEKIISQIPAGKALVPSLEGYQKYGEAKAQAEKQKQQQKEEKKNAPSAIVQAEAADAQRQAMEAIRKSREQTTSEAAKAAATKQLQDQIDKNRAEQAARGEEVKYGTSHQGAVDARSLPYQGNLGAAGAGSGTPGTPNVQTNTGIGAGTSTGGGGPSPQGVAGQQTPAGAGAENIQVPVIHSASMGNVAALGNIGEYTKEFESGSEGSMAMAWDSTGGTSYGTYQYAAKPGGVDDFVNWAKKNGGPLGKAFAEAMYKARPWETGSKRGQPTEVWKKFAQSNPALFAQMEKIGTYELRYKPALKRIGKLAPELVPIIQGNRGLQEALWSTAIQHGCGGASKIFRSTYKPGITPQEWLRNIYAKRSGSFGSSTAGVQGSVKGRFKKEMNIALGLASQSGISFGSTAGALAGTAADATANGQVSTDTGMPGATPGSAKGTDIAGGGGTDTGSSGGGTPSNAMPSAGGVGGSTPSVGGSNTPSPDSIAGQQTPAGAGGTLSAQGTAGDASNYQVPQGSYKGGYDKSNDKKLRMGTNYALGKREAGTTKDSESISNVAGAPKNVQEAIKIMKDLGTKVHEVTSGGGGWTSVAKVDPELVKRMAMAMQEFYKRTGKKIQITSAAREPADQRRMIAQGVPGIGRSATRSPHVRKVAFDIKGNDGERVKGRGWNIGSVADKFEEVAKEFGVYRPFRKRNEEQHFQLMGQLPDMQAPEAKGLEVEDKKLQETKPGEAAISPTDAVKTAGGSESELKAAEELEKKQAEDKAKKEQPQAADLAKEAQAQAKAEADKKIEAAYGSNTGGDSGSGSEVASPSGGTANAPISSSGTGPAPVISTDTGVAGGGGIPSGPIAQTDTPSQSGKIGSDITADAQLQELKLATQLLSQIKDAILQLANKDNKVPEQKSTAVAPQDTLTDKNTNVTQAVAQAFAPSSPAMQSLVNTIKGAFEGLNLGGPQTPTGRADVRTPRVFDSPLNTGKRAPIMSYVM